MSHRTRLAIFFSAFSLAILCVPTRADATSCKGTNDGPHVGNVGFWRPEAMPVDVRPWLLRSCNVDTTHCSLISDTLSVEVDVNRIGDCSWAGYLVEFVPREPLQAGRTYTLVCDEIREESGLGFTTRSNDVPAAPPGELVVHNASPDGEDGGACCPGSSYVDLFIDDLNAPYLREGGRIEAVYPNGDVIPIRDNFVSVVYRLPIPDGPLELTPVAADGTRGETVRIVVDEDAGGPCEIGRQRSSTALWLLLSTLWIGAARRRRRSWSSPG